jgi:hypothetical protein
MTQIQLNPNPSEPDLIHLANLEGKLFVGTSKTKSTTFSDDVKSKIFIKDALARATICKICEGYLDVKKSVSYDHKVRVREGGLGDEDDGQLTRPYSTNPKN